MSSLASTIATRNPSQAQLVLSRYGFKPAKTVSELINNLNAFQVKHKQDALRELASIHPDADLLGAFSEKKSNCGGCSSFSNCSGCGGTCGMSNFEGIAGSSEALKEIKERMKKGEVISFEKKETIEWSKYTVPALLLLTAVILIK